MLSIFPTLLSYNMLVPLIFRLIGGIIFIYFGYATIVSFGKTTLEESEPTPEISEAKNGKIWLWILSLIEIFGGILLLAGLFTQIASLTLSVLIILGMTKKYKKIVNNLSFSSGFWFMLLLATASLLFLGPGFYSIDLPF